MANRYWIGDGGNWSDNTNHWSATTGGAPGASLPTSADNVYFDANSFTIPAQTVTVDATAYCLDMDWTGATNTPTFAGASLLYIYGSLTFIAGMTQTYSGGIRFYAATIGKTITAGGVLACPISFSSSGGWTLNDALNIGAKTLDYRFGTLLDTNGQTITCGIFAHSSTSAKTLTLGASIIHCTFWEAPASGLTLNAGTSSIRVTGTGAFAGGGLTYYEVQLNGTAHTISGDNTFTNLKLLPAGIQTITFTDGTTQTVTNFSRSAGVSVITLAGSSTAGWNITKSGVGRISLDYLSISYSVASPAIGTWYAGVNSTDGGNNTGWLFTSPGRGWWD